MLRHLLSFCCIVLIGCQTPRVTFYDDRAAMEREMATLVPAGMSIAEAKQVIKDNGFTCAEGRDVIRSEGEVTSPGQAFLTCEHDQMIGIFGNYHLTVKFPCTEDGKVGEAVVARLTARQGLARELPPSDTPRPIEPAPLWTKVAAGTFLVGLVVITIPMMALALGGAAGGH